MIKVIVFDFDGVLVDSNRLKDEAWFKIFKPEEVPNALITEVLAEVKATRYDILQKIFERTSVPQDEIESRVARYAGEYNKIVQRGISSMELNPEVEETLSELKTRFNLYLNSATPEKALVETIDRLKIKTYFKKIYGQSESRSKEVNLRDLIKNENILPEEVLVVGDGQDDLAAAKTVGCHFIGLANDWNGWKGKEFPLISNLSEIKNLIVQP